MPFRRKIGISDFSELPRVTRRLEWVFPFWKVPLYNCANLKLGFKIAQICAQKCGRNTQETRENKEANIKN